MIRNILLLIFALTSLMTNAQIDKILGRWITVDDKNGIEKSIVLIFKATDGKYYGRIEKLLEEKYAGALCIPCEGADHNKPVEGLTIIRGMTLEDGILKGGKVLDPESGKFYYGTISYDASSGRLRLRGSLDRRGIFGRNQFWIREE